MFVFLISFQFQSWPHSLMSQLTLLVFAPTPSPEKRKKQMGHSYPFPHARMHTHIHTHTHTYTHTHTHTQASPRPVSPPCVQSLWQQSLSFLSLSHFLSLSAAPSSLKFPKIHSHRTQAWPANCPLLTTSPFPAEVCCQLRPSYQSGQHQINIKGFFQNRKKIYILE